MDPLQELKARIARDHAYLAQKLGLRADIELIVYKVTYADLGEPTVDCGHGITSEWPYAGYKPGVIAIPIEGHALEEASLANTAPPVHVWDGDRRGAWPEWRCDIWHEVCHQYQDERLGKWNKQDGNNGHRVGWRDAVHEVADKVGCDRATFYDLMRTEEVPPSA